MYTAKNNTEYMIELINLTSSIPKHAILIIKIFRYDKSLINDITKIKYR